MNNMIEFDAVWPDPSGALQREVADIWLSDGVIRDPASAQARAGQLLVVARNDSGAIVGASTVIPIHIEQLGFRCFFYRAYVRPDYRNPDAQSTGVVWQVLRASHQHLNERFRSGHDPDVLGLYLEIENPNIAKNRSELMWREDGMSVVYIGRTPEGHPARAWYFDQAQTPQNERIRSRMAQHSV